jgi:hypothetical protein
VLACVTTAVLKYDTELLKQFMGNESFPEIGAAAECREGPE